MLQEVNKWNGRVGGWQASESREGEDKQNKRRAEIYKADLRSSYLCKIWV